MTTKWLEDRFTLQQWPKKFEEEIGKVGWNLFAKYRAVNKDNTNQFADVRIFESIGSDGIVRRLGLVNGNDISKPTFADTRFIPESSRLSNLGIGDGTKTTFEIPSGSIKPGSEDVTIDGVKVANTTYTLNSDADQITFNTAPEAGKIIKMSAYLSSRALEPTNVFGFFTFNDVYFEKQVTRGQADSLFGTADGIEKIFTSPKKPIRPGTLKLFVGSVEVPDTSYTVDYPNGKITFTNAPTAGAVEGDFRYLLTPKSGGIDYGDILTTITGTDMLQGSVFMSLAYAAVTFIQPSLPTIMSLTDDTNLSRSFARDSFVYIWGSINKDRLALFFRADPSAEPIKSFYLPFYFGRLHVNGELPRRNTVLIGGAKTGASIPWAKDKNIGGTLVDYGVNTTNANEHVSLHQSIGGGLYQKHYLAFITHDKSLDTADTKFNPSAYTGKYHISSIWIVHPQEGYVGKLDDLYAIHPKNIEQMDELENEKIIPHEWIGNGDGIRRVFHIEHQCLEAKPSIYGNCNEITNGWTYDPKLKSITFDVPPAPGIELTSSYSMKQLFKYTLPTTQLTPMRLDDATPFNPIGWGIFKENVI